MLKFNSLFITNKTKVLINDVWYVVKEITESRKHIKVCGLIGSFQRGHITKFTNKKG